MRLVPDSQGWPLLCATKGDSTKSSTQTTMPLPENVPLVDAVMEPGDVLFSGLFCTR